jgi:hypothetical protein
MKTRRGGSVQCLLGRLSRNAVVFVIINSEFQTNIFILFLWWRKYLCSFPVTAPCLNFIPEESVNFKEITVLHIQDEL